MFTKPYFNYYSCTQWNIMQQFKVEIAMYADAWKLSKIRGKKTDHNGISMPGSDFLCDVFKIYSYILDMHSYFFITVFNLLITYFDWAVEKNQPHIYRVTLKIIWKLCLLKHNSVYFGNFSPLLHFLLCFILETLFEAYKYSRKFMDTMALERGSVVSLWDLQRLQACPTRCLRIGQWLLPMGSRSCCTFARLQHACYFLRFLTCP